MIYINYIKYGFYLAIIIAASYIYFDWKYQKQENIRQTENNRQLRLADSIKYTSQILSKDEIRQYLENQNTDLQKKLEQSNINTNRIVSIISSTLKYRDTTRRETDLSGLVESIRNNIPKSQEVVDTSKCMTIKGIVSFSDNKLSLAITERTFKNKSDAVAYWERRPWKFLWFKTRIFGKKQFTAKTFDQCGETQTLRIEKKGQKP